MPYTDDPGQDYKVWKEEQMGHDNPDNDQQPKRLVPRHDPPSLEIPDAEVKGGKLDADGGGARLDSGKLRVDLVPAEWPLMLAAVMHFGAQKYADRNWEKGMKWSRVWGPLQRHALKWLAGERIDPDSGLPHLWLIGWNVMTLATYEHREIGDQDIPRDFDKGQELLQFIEARMSVWKERFDEEVQ